MSQADFIPIFDLKAQVARVRDALDAHMGQIVDDAAFVLGPAVGDLEAKLAELGGAAAAVGVASGTDALKVSLFAREIGPGDAVFIPAFTFVATAEAVVRVGATPVFIDIDSDDMTMDVGHLTAQVAKAKAQGLNPGAVMPVDLFGLPARYEEIAPFAEAEGMHLIGDSAQSFGARLNGVSVGALAPLTALSFYPTKPLGCFGDGGAVLTTDADLVERLKRLRHHGFNADRSEIEYPGLNSRLDTLQAAALLARLEVFPDELQRRAAVAARYADALSGRVATQQIREGCESAWAIYTVRCRDRDAVRETLTAEGVGSGVYYPSPINALAYYRPFAEGFDPTPNAAALSREALALPMHPYLTDEAVERVCAAMLKAA